LSGCAYGVAVDDSQGEHALMSPYIHPNSVNAKEARPRIELWVMKQRATLGYRDAS